MNCGIYCVKELLKDAGVDISLIELENKVGEKGISVSDILEFLNQNGLKYDAYYSKKMVLDKQMILYDERMGHFIYLRSYDKHFVYLSDNNFRDFRILRLFYPLIYTKYIIKK